MADDAYTTPIVTHPALERMELRRRMAEAAERLLEAADALIRELGADLPDADAEPVLGAPEGLDQRAWAQGSADDREDDRSDAEPSLGSLGDEGRRTQAEWASGGEQDLEGEHDGREPEEDSEHTLGWSEGEGVRGSHALPSDDYEASLGWTTDADQIAALAPPPPGTLFEGEAQCEDEGHDSDREPDDSALHA